MEIEPAPWEKELIRRRRKKKRKICISSIIAVMCLLLVASVVSVTVWFTKDHQEKIIAMRNITVSSSIVTTTVSGVSGVSTPNQQDILLEGKFNGVAKFDTEFTPELTELNSSAAQNISRQFCSQVEAGLVSAYRKTSCDVTDIREGSIVVLFNLSFTYRTQNIMSLPQLKTSVLDLLARSNISVNQESAVLLNISQPTLKLIARNNRMAEQDTRIPMFENPSTTLSLYSTAETTQAKLTAMTDAKTVHESKTTGSTTHQGVPNSQEVTTPIVQMTSLRAPDTTAALRAELVEVATPTIGTARQPTTSLRMVTQYPTLLHQRGEIVPLLKRHSLESTESISSSEDSSSSEESDEMFFRRKKQSDQDNEDNAMEITTLSFETHFLTDHLDTDISSCHVFAYSRQDCAQVLLSCSNSSTLILSTMCPPGSVYNATLLNNGKNFSLRCTNNRRLPPSEDIHFFNEHCWNTKAMYFQARCRRYNGYTLNGQLDLFYAMSCCKKKYRFNPSTQQCESVSRLSRYTK